MFRATEVPFLPVDTFDEFVRQRMDRARQPAKVLNCEEKLVTRPARPDGTNALMTSGKTGTGVLMRSMQVSGNFGRSSYSSKTHQQPRPEAGDIGRHLGLEDACCGLAAGQPDGVVGGG